ncbi:MAG: hypothetical protein ACXVFE_16785, partial [Gaiellaceae bacterium]
PVGPSVAAWRAGRGDAVEVVVVPGTEHGLELPDGTLAPEYTGTLVSWLLLQATTRYTWKHSA